MRVDSDKEISEENNKAIQRSIIQANQHSIHKTIRNRLISIKGTNWQERIIDMYAGYNPSSTNNADASTSQVLWALQTGGLQILNRFASHNPAPPFEWLELIDKQCCKSYLPEQQWVSLGLVNNGSSKFHWDMFPLCMGHWLLRYIDDSRFVLWIVESGSCLCSMFKHTLLTYLQKYEEKLTVSPQDIIKESNSRSDIPVDILIPLWHLILEDKVISYKKHHDYDYDSDYCTLSEYLKGNTPILIQNLTPSLPQNLPT